MHLNVKVSDIKHENSCLRKSVHMTKEEKKSSCFLMKRYFHDPINSCFGVEYHVSVWNLKVIYFIVCKDFMDNMPIIDMF